MFSRTKKKGQSTLEYVLVFTAIVAAIVLVANGVIGKKIESSLGTVAGKMEKSVSRLPE